MTQKHFTAIAKILNFQLKTAQELGEDQLAEFTIRSFADYFETVNQRFNRLKFLRACGYLKKFQPTQITPLK